MNLLAETIYILRTRKKYTQSYMALKLGVSQSMYSKYETGAKAIPQSKLARIASVLDIPSSQLIDCVRKGKLPEQYSSITIKL